MAQCSSFGLAAVVNRRNEALTVATVRVDRTVRQQTRSASGENAGVVLAEYAASMWMMLGRSAATAEGITWLLKGARWLLHDAQ